MTYSSCMVGGPTLLLVVCNSTVLSFKREEIGDNGTETWLDIVMDLKSMTAVVGIGRTCRRACGRDGEISLPESLVA